jgi:hypothetical protein
MLRLGREALSPTNPYSGSKTQVGDITFGNKNVLSMVAQAALLGQKGAYYHKWLVHRRLRPECFSGRIDRAPRSPPWRTAEKRHNHFIQFVACG